MRALHRLGTGRKSALRRMLRGLRGDLRDEEGARVMSGRETPSREERLKAALRDNLRRRKVQARGRSEPSPGQEVSTQEESGRSGGALARSQGDEGESGMAESGTETELAAKRAEIAAEIAEDLGFGAPAGLGPDQRRIVEAATASTIERNGAIVPDQADPVIAHARRGQLLAEYRALEQLRIDERETLLAGEGGGREDDA